MTPRTKSRRIRACFLVVPVMTMTGAVALAQPAATVETPRMPNPGPASEKVRSDVAKELAERFALKPTRDLQVRVAGPFRFAGTRAFLYIHRDDLDSVAFESASYGTGKALAQEAIREGSLIPRVDSALRKARVEAADRVFAGFQDEYAGAAPKARVSRDYDVRKSARHVARTSTYERRVEGVPVFGSELSVGLNPDGTIGRLRSHWPRLDPALVKEARELETMVRERKWTVPELLKAPDTEILEVRAGVGHSGFADPGFRSAAVVRVTFRRTAKGTEHPISSTSYKYFDARGQEVRFSIFPELPATPEGRKENRVK